jgi:hypothetical protein
LRPEVDREWRLNVREKSSKWDFETIGDKQRTPRLMQQRSGSGQVGVEAAPNGA